jgi:hypothetical protein
VKQVCDKAVVRGHRRETDTEQKDSR